MTKGRTEAFSDGVLAIIITIMVLELKVPHGSDLHALGPVVPLFLSYVLSFLYVGIYWNNHHHLFHATKEIGGGVMWANLALLFCLSLIPVVTAWVGDNPKAPWPSALYGVLLLLCGFAYWVLERTIIARWRSSIPGSPSWSTPASRSRGSSPTGASSPRSAQAEAAGPAAALLRVQGCTSNLRRHRAARSRAE